MAFESTVRIDHEISPIRHKAPMIRRTNSLLTMPTVFAQRLGAVGLAHTCEASKTLAACALGEHRSLDAGAVRNGVPHMAEVLPFAKSTDHTMDQPQLLAS